MEPIRTDPTHLEFDGLPYHFDGHYYTRLIDGKRVMLHRMVWEYHNGPINDGKMHVHHLDKDVHNNVISNLQLICGREHQSMHASEEDRREWARQNMLENAHPAAAQWHGSEAGIEWHKEHAKQIGWVENRPTLAYTCEECGKEYFVKAHLKRNGSKSMKLKYCSLVCKMRAFRRRKENPMDAVDMDGATQKVCEVCGNPYMTNRPDQSKHCGPRCTQKASWLKRKAAKQNR